MKYRRLMECSDCPVERLEADLADLRREPSPTYAEVMAACAAGARRLGVNPAPWEAQV